MVRIAWSRLPARLMRENWGKGQGEAWCEQKHIPSQILNGYNRLCEKTV